MSQPQPQTQTSSFTLGVLSDVGRKRSNNEDNYWVPPRDFNAELLKARGYLCLVADGMGGHAKGEVASQMAVDLIPQLYYADTDMNFAASLNRAFRRANDEVFNAGRDADKAGMGTTVVATIAWLDQVIVAHVGDSRIYLISQGQCKPLTRDHSQVQELVDQGLLTPEQARTHPYHNVITRAIGVFAETEPEINQVAWQPGDALLLCSDGLTNLVSDAEIGEIVSKFPPQKAAEQLIALANKRGGPDNITAIICRNQQSAVSFVAPMATGKMKAVPVLSQESLQGRRLFIAFLGAIIVLTICMGIFVSSYSQWFNTLNTLPTTVALSTSVAIATNTVQGGGIVSTPRLATSTWTPNANVTYVVVTSTPFAATTATSIPQTVTPDIPIETTNATPTETFVATEVPTATSLLTNTLAPTQTSTSATPSAAQTDTPIPTSPAASTPTQTSTTQPDDIVENFTAVNGTCSVTKIPPSTIRFTDTSDTPCIGIFPSRYKDFRLVTTVKMYSRDRVLVVLGYTDIRNRYNVNLTHNNQKYAVVEWVEGSANTLANNSSNALATPDANGVTTNDIELVVKNGKLSVIANGKEIIAAMALNEYKEGNIGFGFVGTGSSRKSEFQSISLEELQ